MNQIIPTYVYSEMTPNPAAMKFVADRPLIEAGAIADFLEPKQAKGYSILAEKLFDFPFVTGIFIMGNFVSVTKNDSISWDMISGQLREFIQEHLMENNLAVEKVPEMAAQAAVDTKKKIENELSVPTEFDAEIKKLLDEFVRPAVENDGGAIDFKSFNDGIVTVMLRGACSGCPSSTVTLKNGIENLLKSRIPAVREVVAEEL